MRNVFILGSTGSIGTQCLAVIAQNPEKFKVAGLAAGGGNLSLLAEQIVTWQVPRVALAKGHHDELSELVAQAAKKLGQPVPNYELLVGVEASSDLALEAQPDDVVLNGITGAIGLEPTLAALSTGATLALANKESLVVGGALVVNALKRPGQIVPVDSEHSAIFQALQSGRHERGLTSTVLSGKSDVAKLILTASGGPFRGRKRADLESVTVAQALHHPTWQMGPVVTINSSTLMNKALEFIEAQLLFDVPPADIIPVIHPQSHIHSMVQWIDGSTIAQTSPPTMMIPIALGLSWPKRLSQVAPPNTFEQPFSWDFEPVDLEAFPVMRLAQWAASAGGTAPAVMNAANEVCVEAFLAEQIPFLKIIDTVMEVCQGHEVLVPQSVAELNEVTQAATAKARQLIQAKAK
ncbi:1-deoxy-D-xylulose-5-phosphate reductoisomerase [Boudabousia tangfeifanii]|uniref:1-deoxy-D-xylulose 5-phosphate reductoisomerase n=1 Tax=Boudabousia tangfeifanii TaxID=1912795 RepID=A0A1D9MKQ8_9ACTO|nr:1-deoxy-D-xylulose-5-phosphate reductoisomerase [Boudabousia tangfeifanii]AOZ72769.1 1-deoxy-D-xylulose-5-phosphate reductoisomerase [Boudabousia tangfeifanii]